MTAFFRKDTGPVLFLIVFSTLLYGWGMWSFALIDPDEPFYALTAREMVQRGDPSVPFLFGAPQFEKPILFYWVLYGCFKVFGVHEWAARMGPALAGLATVLVTYLWGQVLFKRRQIAFLSAVILATAIEFVVLSRIVLTDIFLCLFVTTALACFSAMRRGGRTAPTWFLLIFLFCGLGFLTKGPLGVLIPLLGILPFCVWEGGREKGCMTFLTGGRGIGYWALGLGIFAVVGLGWFVVTTAKYGRPFLEQTFVHENLRRFLFSEHEDLDRPYLYPFVLWMGFFPWTAFVPPALFQGLRMLKKRTEAARAYALPVLTVFAALLFFTLAKSKLVSYIFPVFPAVAVVSAAWLYRLVRARNMGAALKGGLCRNIFVFNVLFSPLLAVGAGVIDRIEGWGAIGAIGLVAAAGWPAAWIAYHQWQKCRHAQALGWALLSALLFYMTVFGVLLPAVDPFFASRHDASVYERTAPGDRGGLLLSSKMMVRGMSYYADSPRMGVVVQNPDIAFYTKHPIPMFSKEEDLRSIPDAEFPVYCFLRPKELKKLRTMLGGEHSVTLLTQNRERVIARLDRLS